MYRLFLKHRIAAMLIIFLTLCAASIFPLREIKSTAWVYAIFFMLFAVISFGLVSSASEKLLKKAEKALVNSCDPTLLAEETAEHLKYIKHGLSRQILVLNHAVALSYIGEKEKVVELLIAEDIEKFSFFSPYANYVKTVYYSNLSQAYSELGDLENASVYYGKAFLYAKKNGSTRTKEMIFSSACELLRKKEYEKALVLLKSFKKETPLDKVCLAMLGARICLATGEKDKAREGFLYVTEHANKLYIAEKARKMLKSIEEGTGETEGTEGTEGTVAF